MLLFCAKTTVKSHANLSEREEKEEEVLQYFSTLFSTTGVLFIMKTLEDER